jgi:hypothetical protein
MRIALGLLPLLAFSALADAAPAEDQAPILRCMVVTGMIANSKDPAQAQAGRVASIFWLGRLDSSLTEAEIERRINQMSATIKVADLQNDVPRCGAEMKARADMMKRVGEKVRQSAVPAEKR